MASLPGERGAARGRRVLDLEVDLECAVGRLRVGDGGELVDAVLAVLGEDLKV